MPLGPVNPGVWAMLTLRNNAVTQGVLAGGWEAIENTIGQSNGIPFTDGALPRVRLTPGGTYACAISCAFTGTANGTYDVAIFYELTGDPEAIGTRDLSGGASEGSISVGPWFVMPPTSGPGGAGVPLWVSPSIRCSLNSTITVDQFQFAVWAIAPTT